MFKYMFLVLIPSLAFGSVHQAIDLLKEVEGFRSKAYKCQAGISTIGYGTTHKRAVVMSSITEPIASNYLQAEVLRIRRMILSTTDTNNLTDNQVAALISLCYNIGDGAYRNSTLRKVINSGELDKVPAAIRMWTKYTDPKTKKKLTSKGLVIRRAKEIKLWLTND